ncbi:HNH endonuclease [Demequina salsinemoris]|uniref:HNH endonuclease n=1 Tax=Demequina salsinemoris TaxID=577470 RepID=UPI000782ADAC|nr:HNH endonuclease signature motif containing protein [Demequina salsinemoris]
MSSDDEMGVAVAQVRAGLAALRVLVDGVESWPERELLVRQEELWAVRRELDVESSRLVAETFRRSDVDEGVGFARGQGFGSPEGFVASMSGGSTAEAGRQARVGKVMDDAEKARRAEEARARAEEAAARARAQGDDEGGAGPGASGEACGGDEADMPDGPVFPVLAEALRRMELSVEVGDVIGQALVRVAEVLDDEELAVFERDAVAKAKGLPLVQVRRMIAAAEARVKPDELKRQEDRAREQRSATLKAKPDGSWRLTAVLDPASAAPIKAFLDGYVRSGFHQQRDKGAQGAGAGGGVDGLGADGSGAGGSVLDWGLAGAGTDPEGFEGGRGFERRSAAQMRADALVALARHGAGCEASHTGVKTTVVVRMTLADLQAGEGVADVDGMDTPVSVATARQLAADAEVIPAVLGGASEVLDWGRKRRLFTRAQAMYLVERDGGCAKCHAPPDWCETHHIRWWDRDSGPTDVANGVLLCTSCHHDVHRDGWGIEIRDHQVWLIPPRHVDATRTPRLGGRAALDLAA